MDVIGIATRHHVSASQRGLELRKFFNPDEHYQPTVLGHNDTLNDDEALNAYTENLLWRLKGAHSMVSLIDGHEQYFLAGTRQVSHSDNSVETTDVDDWFGCSSVTTPGGLCENTIALDVNEAGYPCFIVPDLSKDARFANIPVVNGEVADYRFYAGAPITTSNGINLGSLFLFDDKPRDGLDLNQRKFLHRQAANVIRHLETKREAAERRRLALMSKGIARFLEMNTANSSESPDVEKSDVVVQNSSTDSTARSGNTSDNEEKNDADDDTRISAKKSPQLQCSPSQGTVHRLSKVSQPVLKQGNKPNEAPKSSVLDEIRTTLDHAAEVIRESLELIAGGVVFLDTSIGYFEDDMEVYRDTKTTSVEPPPMSGGSREGRNDRLGRYLTKGSTRDATDKHRATKIQAISAAPVAEWDHETRVLDGKTLQSLIEAHPKGNIWYIDDNGSFSSLEQIKNGSGAEQNLSPEAQRNLFEKQKGEATLLANIFHKARQIMFIPLWDSAGDRWYSGCFVWSQSAVPVFTVDSEISYLSALTNSVMVEINRLDAIIANKMKSDFISSISHEFRSPLHGILASAEFLRESKLDASQIEFISTIQNCSGTLLDTINHVLDYSKINSFEKIGNQQDTISNELYHNTNLALLCEDAITDTEFSVINGMIVAKQFRPAAASSPETHDVLLKPIHQAQDETSVQVILDIDHVDWDFKIQAGAFRRVIMNIFGNAQKYTTYGFILVRLGLQEANGQSSQTPSNSSRQTISLHVRDSGRGMSSEYMERKLYQPFSQENSLATGIGLGLSIVWSIINQLGGKIHIRSELGKGTDVEITLPLDKASKLEETHARPGDLGRVSAEAQEAISTLRARAAEKTIAIYRTSQDDRPQYEDLSWDCIEQYCSAWYGYRIVDLGKDKNALPNILVVDGCENSDLTHISILPGQRVLVVVDQSYQASTHFEKNRVPHTTITLPIGPFKLARSLLALLDQEIPDFAPRRAVDAGTQTPLATPSEPGRTDYGFTIPPTPVSNESETSSVESHETSNSRTPTVAKITTDEEGMRIALKNLQPLTLQQPPLGRFPLSTQDSHEANSIEQQSQPVEELERKKNGDLHILVVDDNKVNLQLLRRYLQKRQRDTIVTAENGIGAVSAFRSSEKPFDIIFMDISMPEMDGFEATRIIRNLEKSAELRDLYAAANRPYVVALTGLASRSAREQAESCGFDDFLTKPISFKKIGELLKKLSEQK